MQGPTIRSLDSWGSFAVLQDLLYHRTAQCPACSMCVSLASSPKLVAAWSWVTWSKDGCEVDQPWPKRWGTPRLEIAWCVIHWIQDLWSKNPFSMPFETVQHLGKPPACKMWCVVCIQEHDGTCRTVQSCLTHLSREENVEKKRRKVSTSSVHGDLDFIDSPPGVTVICTICEGPRWPKHKKITATLAASRAAVFLFGPGSQKSLPFTEESTTGGGSLPCKGPGKWLL